MEGERKKVNGDREGEKRVTRVQVTTTTDGAVRGN